LTHDDVTDWTNYVNKHYTLRCRRQPRRSSDSSDNEEEVPTGRGIFLQPYAFQPTFSNVNYHDDADSQTTGSDDGFEGSQIGSGRSTIGH